MTCRPDITAMSRKERRAYIKDILDTAGVELDARTARGLCWVCNQPVVGGEEHCFDATHCAKHSHEAELEQLIEDQEDDRG